uniref:Uncharacterized protein n=1 Tax=Cacopsylla melanoneura TaxID=428564 RepID=A0A8D9BDW5_9HEMI
MINTRHLLPVMITHSMALLGRWWRRRPPSGPRWLVTRRAAVHPHSRGRTAGPGRCRGGRGECLCLLASVCGVPAPWWWRAGGLVHYGGVAVLLLLPRNFGSLAVLTGHTGETKLKLFKE